MKVYYICKYTPIEIIESFGDEAVLLDYTPQGFERAENHIHPNVCGFGKAVLEAVLNQGIKNLVLARCCDTIKSVYDVLSDLGCMDFLYMFDLMHDKSDCSRLSLEESIRDFMDAYESFKGQKLDKGKFINSFKTNTKTPGKYISLSGARVGDALFREIAETMPLPVKNETCVNNRNVVLGELESQDEKELISGYAQGLLSQMPCMRMHDPIARRALINDPDLSGIIYHTIKFCDFYGFEYTDIKDDLKVPLLKLESDYTASSGGQLKTRLEAFGETLAPPKAEKKKGQPKMGKGYFAGIDSGSTSTDVVIIDRDENIITDIIIPTGAGASLSASKALDMAASQAGLKREDIDALVTTGYGRDNITIGDKSITEITCHARGAKFLDNRVRTVIDIGGQDSKVILLDEEGNVTNFVMNDKCAAGTGRFLEMMANTLQISLDEMSKKGLSYKEDITISSMCTVFAESEVVSLIANNKPVDDIVHGLNKSVAVKTVSLVKRVNGGEFFMMTGGVSKNQGLVKALEEKLGHDVIVDKRAQICGALGAALFAKES